MSNSDNNLTLLELAKNYREQGKSLSDIENALRLHIEDENTLQEIIRLVKKDMYQAAFKRGVTKVGIASVILVSSFVYSCINYHNNEPFTMVMYGLTSTGTAILLWGFYEIFN